MINFSRIKKTLLNSRRVTILTHRNCDPDALCSAYVLSRLMKRVNPKLRTIIGTPEGLNKISIRIKKEFKVRTDMSPDMRKADMLFLVDTNSLQQLGPLQDPVEKIDRPIIVIDHHYPSESRRPFTHKFCDDASPSTCEIIYGFYRDLAMKPMRREAAALLVGILYETRYLRLATSKTLLTVADLIRSGAKVEVFESFFEAPMDDSERMARIKSAQRSKVIRYEGYIIATSSVGSHQASAARALTSLGVDLAIVGGEEKGELKLSLRSTSEFYRKSGIHLGRDIAKPLGDYIRGTGGGHSLAAGVNGYGDLENILNKSLELVKELIRTSKNR
ncbi:MAG: DHH family phosphoesterase [Candidatus Bathyarchaeia archaeon]